MITVDSWVAAGLEYNVTALTRDATHIYAAMYDDTAASTVILKIDPSDMSEVDRLVLGEYTAEIVQMATDGGYLYVPMTGGDTFHGVYKVNTSNMEIVDSYTGEFQAHWSVTVFGGYVYAGNRLLGRLEKIDPSDMSPVDYYAGYYPRLANDGTYVYGSVDGDAIIRKIDPSDMSLVDSWSGAPAYGSVAAMDYGAGFLFASTVSASDEGTLSKIDVSTMEEVDTLSFTETPTDIISSVLYDNSAVYVGWYNASPAKVYKVDPTTFEEVDFWEGAGGSTLVSGLVFITDIFVGLWITPAEIDKVSEAGVTYTLTVNIVGSGSVTKDPPPAYPPGTPVTLEAIPAAGWAFSEWTGDLTGSDNPKVITMDSDKTVTATFIPLFQYTLTTHVTGLGSVTKNPSQVTYDPGEVVEVTAVPGDSWFSEWTGDLTGSTNPQNITMDGNKDVTAIFSQEKLVAVFTEPSGYLDAQALAGDTTSLYAAVYGQNALLRKISKSDMTLVSGFTILDLQAPYSMLFDGTNVFFGHKYHPFQYAIHNARVLKLQTDPFSSLLSWWGGASGYMADPGFHSLAYDTLNIYFGVCYFDPGGVGLRSRVVKILKSDMSAGLMWTNDIGDKTSPGPAVCHDGTYLYAGPYPLTGPLQFTGKIYKIDPATMTTLLTWTGATGEYKVREIIFDGTYIYAGLYTSPAKVIKIDPTTMTTVAVWTGVTGQDFCRAICLDGSKLYAGLGVSPAQVVEINPATMLTIQNWTGVSGQNIVSALTPDFIYASLMSVPGKVVKLFFPLHVGSTRSFGSIIG